MSRLILAAEAFLDEAMKKRLTDTAKELGFTARCYQDAAEIGTEIADCEILFGNGFRDRLREAVSLRWYHCSFAGVEPYLPREIWPPQDCLFTNSSGAFGVTISEHVVMVLLMLLRRMPAYQRDLACRAWTVHTPIRSVRGLRVTMVGAGDIGTRIARSLSAMGAEVRGVRRDLSKPADPAFSSLHTTAELDALLPETDALILALPATAATRGILTRERLALLPESSYVINVGRGAAIDQEALMDALNGDRLAGAALDVMVPEPLPADHPLWETKNLLLTPHCSGNTALRSAAEAVLDIFLDDLHRYAAGQPLRNIVDRQLGY